MTEFKQNSMTPSYARVVAACIVRHKITPYLIIISLSVMYDETTLVILIEKFSASF